MQTTALQGNGTLEMKIFTSNSFEEQRDLSIIHTDVQCEIKQHAYIVTEMKNITEQQKGQEQYNCVTLFGHCLVCHSWMPGSFRVVT